MARQSLCPCLERSSRSHSQQSRAEPPADSDKQPLRKQLEPRVAAQTRCTPELGLCENVVLGFAVYDHGVNVFGGVDIERISAELSDFLQQTTPRQNPSSWGTGPRCGRAAAIALTERIKPILDTLYPLWSDENPESLYDEFAHYRDACVRLIGQIQSRADIEEMLGNHDASPLLAANQFHPHVWTAASAQWSTGHHHEAVLAAAKAVNSMLQAKLNRRDVSEVNLVQEAFSQSDPAAKRPRLRFLMIQDERTRDSMTQGALSFGVGCFQAIRNPVGHLPNEEHELSEQDALERLAALSLLARWIDQADLVTTD